MFEPNLSLKFITTFFVVTGVVLMPLASANAHAARRHHSSQTTTTSTKSLSTLADLLEGAVEQDSTAWSMNQFDANSISNVAVVRSGQNMRIRGEYTYNGGNSGWVEAEVIHGKVTCLQYWDTSDCADVRYSESGEYRHSQPTVHTCYGGKHWDSLMQACMFM